MGIACGEQMLVKGRRCEPMTEALVRMDDHFGRDIESLDDRPPRVLGGGAEDEEVRRTAVGEAKAHIDRAAFASGRENKGNAVRERGMVEQYDLLDLNAVKKIASLILGALFLE